MYFYNILAGEGHTPSGSLNVASVPANETDYNYTDGTWFTTRQSYEEGWSFIIHKQTGKRLYSSDNLNETGLTGFVKRQVSTVEQLEGNTERVRYF